MTLVDLNDPHQQQANATALPAVQMHLLRSLKPGEALQLHGKIFPHASASDGGAHAQHHLDPLPVCIVPADVVTDAYHVRYAIYQALKQQAAGTMSAKTLATEIVYQLSPSIHVSDAIRHFGLNKNETHTRDYLIIYLAAQSDRQEPWRKFVRDHHLTIDDDIWRYLDDPQRSLNFPQLKKVFKLPAATTLTLPLDASARRLIATALATKRIDK